MTTEQSIQFVGATRSLASFSLPAEALTVRITPERDYCAVCLTSGSIQLIPLPHKQHKLNEIEFVCDDEKLACTALVFLPKQSDKKKILAVYASGFVRLWQYQPSGKTVMMKSLREVEWSPEGEMKDCEPKYNSIMCVSISHDGKRFVTGGADTVIRAYDMASFTGRSLMPSIRTDIDYTYNFHTNRVTAILYHTRGEKDSAYSHLFVSASWDGTIQGWDDRVLGSLWQIAGTNVPGTDGICIDPIRNFLVTASYKHDKFLSQVWDISFTNANMKKIVAKSDKPLSTVTQEAGSPAVRVYVARLTPGNQYLLLAGASINFIKLIHASTYKQIASVISLPVGVYSADSCIDPTDKRRLLVAFTNGSKVHVIVIDPRVANLAELH